MLKVLVYDSGWGGELVADYLANELKVVEVTRLIDWRNLPYGTKSSSEIKHLLCENLKNHIGKVNLVVLGGFVVSEYIEYLRKQFPNQAFVGLSIDINQIIRSYCQSSSIAIFIGCQDIESHFMQDLRSQLPGPQLATVKTEGWEELIDDGEISSAYIRCQLAPHFKLKTTSEREAKRRKSLPIAESLQASRKIARSQSTVKVYTREGNAGAQLTPDVVILLNTHFWEIEHIIEQLFGWRVCLVDFRQKLLHDVCAALKLRGVDGARHKCSSNSKRHELLDEY